MFGSAIAKFSINLEALRDFVDLIAPILAQKSIDEMQCNAHDLVPLALALSKVNADLPQLDEEDEIRIKEKFGIVDFTVEEHKDSGKRSVTMQVDRDKGRTFDQAVKCLGQREYQKDLLYRSSLINLVSSAECFLSKLLHIYFDKFPDTVGSREKAFSLEDLNALGTIQDARSYLIDSRVEAILRGSFEDWIDYLKQHLHLSMKYLEPHKDRLIEVCQRRNVLIHNDGIINSIYLSKVPASLKCGLSAGNQIRVTQEYLDEAICIFERCFILIAAELWKKLDPSDEKRSTSLINIAFNHLRSERWDVAEGLSYFTMNDKQHSEQSRLIGTINYWQSLKWQDRFDEIRKEVTSADFSAKDELFRLAHYALLDDETEFFNILPRIFESKKLSTQEFEEWPIFRKMRSTQNYLCLCKELVKQQTDAQIDHEISEN